MKVKFSAQPFADGTDLRDFLIDALRGGEEHSSLTAVVAWAKRSGLSRLAPFLQDFRARGGTTRLIVGIDEGGATRQGLTLARELFSTVHIFHERTARTFHPKIYLATSDISARLLVGSNNLTAGGLFYNYEAGLWCDLDLTLAEDAELAESVQTYIARLYDDESVCLDLTDELLTTLIRNPEYRVGNEDQSRRVNLAGTNESVDSTVDVENESELFESVFGSSAEQKRPALPVPNPSAQIAPPPPPASTPPSQSTAGPSPSPVVKRWFKKMSASDAQHPPTPGSNVTGVLRLVQARLPINQTTYFRQDFFGSLNWVPQPRANGVLERVSVDFDVTINGQSYGSYVLRIDDDQSREAGQGNYTSALHWDDLGGCLAGANLAGHFVILERLLNVAFRLIITPLDPGANSFIP